MFQEIVFQLIAPLVPWCTWFTTAERKTHEVDDRQQDEAAPALQRTAPDSLHMSPDVAQRRRLFSVQPGTHIRPPAYDQAVQWSLRRGTRGCDPAGPAAGAPDRQPGAIPRDGTVFIGSCHSNQRSALPVLHERLPGMELDLSRCNHIISTRYDQRHPWRNRIRQAGIVYQRWLSAAHAKRRVVAHANRGHQHLTATLPGAGCIRPLPVACEHLHHRPCDQRMLSPYSVI